MRRPLVSLVAGALAVSCSDHSFDDEPLVGPVAATSSLNPESNLTPRPAIGAATGSSAGQGVAANAALADSRMFWDPNKGAFRAGRVLSNEWDVANIGVTSVAMGLSPTASGLRSVAIGDHATASGEGAIAMGFHTNATGFNSMATGENSEASGQASTAMGGGAIASGQASTAMGGGAIASGNHSTAMGLGTTAQAAASLVLGRFNVIAGDMTNWIGTDPVLVVGNGTLPNPSNALTLLKNGNLGLGNTVTPQRKLHIKKDPSDPQIRLEDPNGFYEFWAGTNFLIKQDGTTDRLIIVGATGNVGIGATLIPDKLTVGGDVRVGLGVIGCVKDADATVIAGTCISDVRVKKNITRLPAVLASITELSPVHFNWRTDEFPERALGEERQLGLIAQEVERVLPRLVVEGEDGLKRVRYSDLPLLLLQATKEQQQQLATLRAENQDLRAQVAGLASAVRRLEAAIAGTQN